MKVLHIGMTSHFTDKMLYQDNILADLNAKAGHDVVFISDTFFYKNGTLVKTNECDVVLDNGVRLIRISYDRIINEFITRKIQKAKKLLQYLDEIRPDTILYHGVCGYELINIAKYIKEKKLIFYIDSHENFKNTAMTPLAKFAYKYVHGYFVRKALPVAKKVLYVGYPEKEYLEKMYHIPESKLEYFPLGGLILEKEKQDCYRAEIISKMNFPNDVIICTHSGKMDKGKKTEDILKAFMRVQDSRLRLLIFGSIPEDMKDTLEPLINGDERIFFLGWKEAKEQELILGATDLYIQPGTYSATAQIAICDGCALLVNNDYKRAMGNNAIYGEDVVSIKKVLEVITSNIDFLDNMKKRAYSFATKMFDYKKIADRYLI